MSPIRKHIPSSKPLTDFTASHGNVISVWTGSCRYLRLAKRLRSRFVLLWVGEEEQFSLSFYFKQSFLRDEAIWKPVVKNCTWIWKCTPRHAKIYIWLQRHQYCWKAASISSATAAYPVPSLRKLNPRQFICTCLRLTTQILWTKLEVKIDSLEQTVDVTRRAP